LCVGLNPIIPIIKTVFKRHALVWYLRLDKQRIAEERCVATIAYCSKMTSRTDSFLSS
jgi:hypothetical protein